LLELSFNSSPLDSHAAPSEDGDLGRRAGYFGLASSECDSPLSLINSTFSFLSSHFPSSFDYLVWTGDNARHDLDPEVLPRTLEEIVGLNEFVAKAVRRALGEEVTIVASLGNNDVWPHNIMFPGREYCPSLPLLTNDEGADEE
jgi:endopolyphosphatase